MPKFAALIAAAGISSRMGFPKALMQLQGKAAALKLAETFLAATIEQIIITMPDCFIEGQDLEAELKSLNIILIKNHFANLGYAGSIMSGMPKLSPACQGLFISPIDVLFKATLIREIRLLAQSAQKPLIIVPHCPLLPGHPVYVSHHFFPALRQCHNFRGLNRLIGHFASAVVKLAFFDRNLLLNINEPGLLKALNTAGSKKIRMGYGRSPRNRE